MAVAQYPQIVYAASGHQVVVKSDAHASTLPAGLYSTSPALPIALPVLAPTVVAALNTAQIALVNQGLALAAFDPTYRSVRLFTTSIAAITSGLFNGSQIATLQAHGL